VERQVVIVGAGHAAGQAVVSLRQHGFTGRIVLIGDEPYLPYQRPPLSKKFLAGEMPAERLYVKPATFYADHDVDVRRDTRVVSIDREQHTVTTQDGDAIDWDELVLATGSRVRRLPDHENAPGGIHYLRTIGDVLALRGDLGAGRRVVIIGAGYIGLEVAAVARNMASEVTVVEMADRVMSRVVAPDVSVFYASEHRRHGVELRFGSGLAGFEGDERVRGVFTTAGDVLPADTVVVGVGIEPVTELAQEAGLAVDDGIVVDARCRTADTHIYAIGDCTAHPSALYGRRLRLESVHNALEQAKTAALAICGEPADYDQVPWFWSDQYDLKLQIAGLSQGHDRVVLRGDPDTRSFSCLYLAESRLLAIDCINAPRDFVQAKALIERRCAPDATRVMDTSVALKDCVD